MFSSKLLDKFIQNYIQLYGTSGKLCRKILLKSHFGIRECCEGEKSQKVGKHFCCQAELPSKTEAGEKL
jgi:hypothetical protein